MRLRSITRISLMAIGASLAALLAVPYLRVMALTAFRPALYDPHFDEWAMDRPDDYRAWLAALAAEPEPDAEAYRHAAGLAPEDPAPHMIYALKQLPEVPLNREEMEAFITDVAITEKPLTPSQRAALETAQQALDRVAELDPDNVAADFLRAYLAFAAHDDERARAFLRQSLAKTRFTLYTRAVQTSAHKTAESHLPPFYAAVVAQLVAPVESFGEFRQMARVLLGMSLIAEREGDHDRAILLRESLLHMGERMWRDSDALIDALVGEALWGVAASKRLTDAERRAATKGIAKPEAETIPDTHDPYWEALRTAEREKLTRYLRQHGRDDLADSIIRTARLRKEWSAAARASTGDSMGEWMTWKQYPEGIRVSGEAAGLLLGLAGLLALTGLVMRSRGAPPEAVERLSWGWVVVLVVCGMIGAVTAVGISGLVSSGDEPSAIAGVAVVCVAVLVAVLGIAAAAVVRAYRRREHQRARAGFVRQYVGTSLAFLLLLTSLVCLLLLGVTAAAAYYASTMTRRVVGEIYQGEMHYRGLAPEQWEDKVR